MNIRHMALAILAASSALVAAAQEPCGLRAAQLLASGQTSELAALFKKPSIDTTTQLTQIAAKTGALTQITAANGPLFSDAVQHSALSADLPANFGFKSLRVNAVSSYLGSVQLHVAVELARIFHGI